MVKFRWEKPSSLYWQHSLWADAAYALYREKILTIYQYLNESRDTAEFRTPNVRFDAGYTIGWYPNSRTSLNLTVSGGVESPDRI